MAAKKKASAHAPGHQGTPPDAPGTETAADPKPTPGRKNRFTFYPDGKDYVLVAVQTNDQGEPLPNGALSAIPDTPRFESAQEGERWVRAAGDKLAGMLVICVRMMWRLRVLVQQKPVITVTKDERFQKSLEEAAPAEAAEPAAAAAS